MVQLDRYMYINPEPGNFRNSGNFDVANIYICIHLSFLSTNSNYRIIKLYQETAFVRVLNTNDGKKNSRTESPPIREGEKKYFFLLAKQPAARYKFTAST